MTAVDPRSPASINPARTLPAADRVVFAPSVEALLLRGISQRMTPALNEKLKAKGIDLSRPLLPGYPSSLWQEVIELVARELHPDLAMAAAQWQLGASTVHGFEQTLIGKAMVALAKVIGTRRALLRFPSMSRTSNNFAHMTAEEVTGSEILFTINGYEGLPEYVLGCLSALIEVTGGKDPKVEVVSHDRAAERLVIRARWS